MSEFRIDYLLRFPLNDPVYRHCRILRHDDDTNHQRRRRYDSFSDVEHGLWTAFECATHSRSSVVILNHRLIYELEFRNGVITAKYEQT